MSQPWVDRQGESSSPDPVAGPGSAPWTGAQPSAVQPYPGQPYSAQPHVPPQPNPTQPYAVQPYAVQPYAVQPHAVQPHAVQPYAAQPYSAQPYSAQPYSPGAAVGGNLVSAGGRVGAFLLDGLLCLVTLGIGYLIWALITWSDGQTPAKRLLGHVVVDAQTGVPFDWGRMALRQFVLQGLLGGILSSVTLGIYFWVDALMVFGERQRTLHDRMANSVVRHV